MSGCLGWLSIMHRGYYACYTSTSIPPASDYQLSMLRLMDWPCNDGECITAHQHGAENDRHTVGVNTWMNRGTASSKACVDIQLANVCARLVRKGFWLWHSSHDQELKKQWKVPVQVHMQHDTQSKPFAFTIEQYGLAPSTPRQLCTALENQSTTHLQHPADIPAATAAPACDALGAMLACFRPVQEQLYLSYYDSYSKVGKLP